MAIDLRIYDQKPGDWEWAEREEKRLEALGKITLPAMQNAIYSTLLEIPEGQYLDIEVSVKKANHEIFVKTVCEFLAYYPNYRFNRLMNRVYHDMHITFRTPNETDPERKQREAMERARRRLPALQC